MYYLLMNYFLYFRSKRTSRQDMDNTTPVREDPTNQSENAQEENVPLALESPTPPE